MSCVYDFHTTAIGRLFGLLLSVVFVIESLASLSGVSLLSPPLSNRTLNSLVPLFGALNIIGGGVAFYFRDTVIPVAWLIKIIYWLINFTSSIYLLCTTSVHFPTWLLIRAIIICMWICNCFRVMWQWVDEDVYKWIEENNEDRTSQTSF